MSSAARIPAEYRFTYRDWLRLPDTNAIQELIDGEIHVAPTPIPRHQRVSGRIFVALHEHVERGGRGAVFQAPLGVRLSNEDVPEPDVFVILNGGRARVGEDAIEGPPDLVVEVLSPGTAGRDLVEKRALYEKYAIAEYWIVDVKRERIEVLVLRGGRYETAGTYACSDTLRSGVLPDLALDVAAIFAS